MSVVAPILLCMCSTFWLVAGIAAIIRTRRMNKALASLDLQLTLFRRIWPSIEEAMDAIDDGRHFHAKLRVAICRQTMSQIRHSIERM